MMLSAASPWQRIRELPKGKSLKEIIGLLGALFVDSGGLAGGKANKAYKPAEVLARQCSLGADIAATLDDPAISLLDPRGSVALKKHSRSVKNALHAFDARPSGLKLFAAVSAKDPGLLGQSIKFLEKHADFEGYALGGLAFFPGTQTKIIDSIIEARSAAPSKSIHVFGVGGLSTLGILHLCGATSFDSSSATRCAAYRLPFSEDEGALRSRRIRRSDLMPCVCPVCSTNTTEAIMNKRDLLIRHNLWVVALEIRKIRHAEVHGDLERLVAARASRSTLARTMWRHVIRRLRQGY